MTWRGPCPFCGTPLRVRVRTIQDIEEMGIPRPLPGELVQVIEPLPQEGGCPGCTADTSLIWQAIDQERSEGRNPGWRREQRE